MNYIYWKNIDSRDINGLMICELPPITKPKMRTKIETIDGRDGSIITELGYEAYDKVINIGLTRNFDIDEVIEYFTGAGILNMSNEPDKYYKGRIIDGIDYERLLRFRTAKVKINVQPFKYSTLEKTKTIIPSTQSVDIWNNGNTISKPTITLYGTGIINMSLNGEQIFTLDFLEDGSITIDSEQQEAYKGTVLKNRQMNGQFPTLKVGKNILAWSGAITKIEILRQSRWL